MSSGYDVARPALETALTTTQIQQLLDRVVGCGARSAALVSPDGEIQVCVEGPMYPPESVVDGAIRVPIVVRDRLMAFMDVVGSPSQISLLDPVAQIAASGFAEAWEVAQEIDSLASEIVHAYEELHLLYDLGEALTGQTSVISAVGLILDKVTLAVPVSSVELRLEACRSECFRRMGSLAQPDPGAGEHCLVIALRSGGQPIGEIALRRPLSAAPFSSIEAKLLDGVATIAASTLNNAQLYEDLRRQADTLKEREAHLSAVMDSVAEGILTVDESSLIRSMNPAAEDVFCYQAKDAIGQAFCTLVPDDSRGGEVGRVHAVLDALLAGAPSPVRLEAVGRRRDGTSFAADLTIGEAQASHGRLFIVSVRDVTDRKRWEAALQHQAHHDALTDLPNRTLLHDRLIKEIRAARQASGEFALLLMDLDHFKEVNDSLGHQSGDQLLQQIGPRILGALGPDDLLARLGGDEFAMVLANADPGHAARVSIEILQVLDRPFVVDGHALSISASLGIAMFPRHGEDPGTLLRHADIAMYDAKRAQSGFQFFDEDREQAGTSLLEVKGELRNAIDRDQLVLYYQPQIDLHNLSVARVEALVRWRHPRRGLVMPSQFVGLAEQTGLMDSLSHWILDAALHQCRQWLDAGHEVGVSVNLSAQNLRDGTLPDLVSGLLKSRGVPPELLRVELTESSLMSDPVLAMKVLTRLGAMGVQTGIDDFGTGYSSLTYLKRLPVHEIKIDKSFVLHMTRDDNDKVIVQSTIRLAHDLGLTAVAEGVENRWTWNLLSSLGCDLAQGYYLSHPILGPDVPRWLRRSPWRGLAAGPILGIAAKDAEPPAEPSSEGQGSISPTSR